MNPQIDNHGHKHLVNAVATKQASLLSLVILVVVVFSLQRGMSEITKWLAPEGNLLKLMVISRLVLSILLPVWLFLIILRLSARHALGLYPPPWRRTILAVILGFILIFAVNMALPLVIQPSQKLAEATSSIVAYGNLSEFLLSFLTVSIFASVVDEFFFVEFFFVV